MDNAHLAEHLRFFQELGVTGLSLDARWRRRAADAGPAAQAIERLPVIEPIEPSAPAEDNQLLTVSRSPEEALQAIRAEIGDCTRCKLHRLGRRQIVFGVGNPSADLMFVGEAPGADEDIQGIPFVGRAGQLLTKIIEAIGLSREDVYIANVIKCRPPENRNPEPDEVETCEPFLFQQIDRIQAKGHRRAWNICREGAVEDAGSDLTAARPRFRLPRRDAHPDVPSSVSAAQPGAQAGRLGGHEESARAPPGVSRR